MLTVTSQQRPIILQPGPADCAKPLESAAALRRQSVEGGGAPPLHPLAWHLDLRILKHFVFPVFGTDYAQNAHGTAAKIMKALVCATRRGALNVHETRATATLALAPPPATLAYAQT